MTNIFKRGLLGPVKSYWRAVLRFGSPRFSLESVIEPSKSTSGEEDRLDDELCRCCQLEAA